MQNVKFPPSPFFFWVGGFPDRLDVIPATVIFSHFSFAVHEPFRNKGLRFHCVWMCVELVFDVVVQWYLYLYRVYWKMLTAWRSVMKALRHYTEQKKKPSFGENISVLCIGEIDTLFSMLDYFLGCLHKPCTHVLNHTTFRKMCVNYVIKYDCYSFWFCVVYSCSLSELCTVSLDHAMWMMNIQK